MKGKVGVGAQNAGPANTLAVEDEVGLRVQRKRDKCVLSSGCNNWRADWP